MDENLEISVDELSCHIGRAFGAYVTLCINLTELMDVVLRDKKAELMPDHYEKFKLFTDVIYTSRDAVPFVKSPVGFGIISSGYHLLTNVDLEQMISRATDEQLIEALERSKPTLTDHIRRYDNYFESQTKNN